MRILLLSCLAFLPFTFAKAKCALSTEQKKKIFPMLPRFAKKAGDESKKIFKGVEIPRESWDSSDPVIFGTNLQNIKAQLNQWGLIFVLTDKGMALGLTPELKREKDEADRCRKFKETGIMTGAGSYVRSGGFGISFNFGSREDSNVDCHVQQDIFMLNFNIGQSAAKHTYHQGGVVLNIQDPLTSIMDAVSKEDKTADAFQIATSYMRYAGQTPYLMMRDADYIDWPESQYQQLDCSYKKDLALANSVRPPAPPQDSLPKHIASYVDRKIPQYKMNIENFGNTISQTNGLAPLWNNLPAQQWIQSICDWIAAKNSIPREINLSCRIFASLKPSAFQYPNGDLFISAGMLGALDKGGFDTLLLFVSHEIAHIVARHGYKLLETENGQAQFASSLALFSGLFNILKIDLPEDRNLSTRMNQMDLGFERAAISTLVRYTKDHEDEADHLGWAIAVQAGMNPNNAIQGWSLLTSEFDRLGLNSQTHSQYRPMLERQNQFQRWNERTRQIDYPNSASFNSDLPNLSMNELSGKFSEYQNLLRPFYLLYRNALEK